MKLKNYRNIDESYRARTFSEQGGFENSLNLVESSTWIEWLHSESQGYYRGGDIKHYSIINTFAKRHEMMKSYE